MSPENALAMMEPVNFVVSQFIGGQAFFVGIALCVAGCLLINLSQHLKVRMIARIAILAGVVVVALSAAPFAFWLYGLLFALLALAAGFRPAKGRWQDKTTNGVLLLLLVAQSILMVRTEVLHFRRPTIPFAAGNTLLVFGDSMCIGADPPGKNWPDLLGDLAQLKVSNMSAGGATVASWLDQARLITPDTALVIIEVGGNDLLGGTAIPKFREDLETMLDSVCGPNRRVVMIELPLPPFYNRFGMVQRELAQSHGVTLIAKRYLAETICRSGATVDGLHLSNTGHTLFAHKVFDMLTQAQRTTECPTSGFARTAAPRLSFDAPGFSEAGIAACARFRSAAPLSFGYGVYSP